jgi:3-deoxy-D-manno-octulosonic-acid transferase
MAYHFQRIKPKVIIIVRHQISPALVLLAHLYKVPIFLIDAHLSQRTERLLYTSNDFYWRILQSFDQILVEEDADKKAFQNIDIDSNKISTVGPLRACNIMHRKKMLLDYFEISEQELNKKFAYPILLAHSLNKKTLELYLALFSSLKQKIPNLKMILSPGCALSWKKDMIHLAQAAHHRLYTWDFNNVNGVMGFEKSESEMFLQKLEKIFTSNDIILSCIDGSLFFWNAFAKIFLTDETAGPQGNDNFFEATAWKNPIILGPKNPLKMASIKSELSEKKILMNVENKEQLTNKIIELILNENFRIFKGEEGYAWLKKISRECDNGFKPFFEKLKKIITQ